MKWKCALAAVLAAVLSVHPLILNAGDESDLSRQSWEHYNRGRYDEAYDGFSKLYKAHPEREDYGLGLAYSLILLNRPDEALRLADAFKAGSKEFRLIRLLVYSKKADEALAAKDYPMAATHLKNLLELDPGDVDAEKKLGQSLYNAGMFREALPIYLSLFRKLKEPKYAAVILGLYEKTGDTPGAFEFAGTLAGEESPVVKKTAADFYFRRGCPITAAQTYNAAGLCYWNADKPKASLETNLRYKSGDKGFSRLLESAYTLNLSTPFRTGNRAGFTLAAKKLSSGPSPQNPFAGNYFRGTPLKNTLNTSSHTAEPKVFLEREGPGRYSLELGSSPVGGVLSPKPVFSLGVSYQRLNLNVHETPVEESILSHTGLKDPYGNGRWGRVLKSGGEAEYTTEPTKYYWLTLGAGYDYYWGEHTIKNRSERGTVSIGRTFASDRANLSIGLFTTAMRFKQNTNFYTFGHGGYFSPARLVVAGPTVRLQTKPCGTYRLDGQVSASYLNFRTKNARQYPFETTGKASSLEFNGDKSSGMGYGVEVKGVKLLTSRLELAGSFKLNKSASYREWLGALLLSYLFEPRSTAALY